MTKFINIDLDNPIHPKFLLKHIEFAFIWILGISLVIFRLDLFVINYLPIDYKWVIKTIPVLYILGVIIFMYNTKWYYNLTLFFYPVIILFWFLPKFILHKGKIYLLSNYITFIYNRLSRFKKSFAQIGIFTITLFVLVISDSSIIRICSMLIMIFFYYKYLVYYVKSSFKPAQLFGAKIEELIDTFLETPDNTLKLVESIEDSNKKDDEKNLKTLITYSFIIETFGKHLTGFQGKKAFVISWLYQLLLFLIISVTFFTFLNYELFKIDSSNFTILGNPNIFDFIYYTIKTIVFENSMNIIPFSPWSKIIEMFTFFTLGIFLFVFVTSIIFTMKQDRISENISKASDLCLYQNEAIVKHIKLKYNTDVQTVIKETENIRNSLENMKIAMTKLF